MTLNLVPNVSAKACTTTQLTQLSSVAATYSSSPDCAGSAMDPSTSTVAVICAGACMKLVRQLQPDAPDCEYDGTNLGESMSRLVTWCDEASVSASGSASTSSLDSSAGVESNSRSVDTPDTVPACSMENITLISGIDTEAATSADCLGSAGAATSASNKDEFCGQNKCIAYLADAETRLPNCTYGGYNFKQAVADTLALCADPTLTWAPSTTPPATRATIPTATIPPPTATSLASSQTADAPATSTSTASALKRGESAGTAAAIVLTVLFALSS
ncbi:hypothetical protein PF005_g18859 [Phytophthora fragariae]|nr:hypothetical protein PF009_g18602 [Phytophthora fragariae]KAE9091607.1 hypothetical protein PF007_g18815 [Phytophthora fragariae]KAE9091831.1 hypothetical protein PF010_g18037 [Phytophthora fragariae]KAE9118576.1 hypothetical protein PF006_g18556 [Phytophthora fragariae]KAE9191405.1 hypothetical protein PF005_g18859 [Phytophthora fragariae]